MMKRRSFLVLIVFIILVPIKMLANHVRVDSLTWNAASVSGGSSDVLKMSMIVSWDNSWRDDYNHDAVYLFFKFKLKESDAESPAKEWNHLYLLDDGHQVSGNVEMDYWLSPLSVEGQNLNVGMFLYRKTKSAGDNRVKLEVSWNIKNQWGVGLTADNFLYSQVEIAAHAIEMVYVPRGAYRIGDGVSEKSFCRKWFPIEAEYDLLNTTYTYASSTGSKPEVAADRLNDNTASTASVWTGGEGKSWWRVDFGEGNAKVVKWFGVNGYKHQPAYIPLKFSLLGKNDPDDANTQWTLLWTGTGSGNWIMADDAYPVQKAIAVPNTKAFRSYMIEIDGMQRGVPMISSIAMSDRDLNTLVDPSVLIDSPITKKDTLRGLGAADGSVWTGNIPASFPNGYRGFYAMKYEISQEQYVRFLNKLSYRQQNTILNGLLDQLQEGDYIFGETHQVSFRNGIILATKIPNKSAVFTCNLMPNIGWDAAGGNIACNYMNMADMLAYADWAGLRPLTEMEYEKMARPGFPYIPSAREYAWNSTKIEPAVDLGTTAGTTSEHPARGNANYDNTLGGPLRCGAFATSQINHATRQHTGAGYSGVMELSGNLSEMYYNANNPNGLNIVSGGMNGAAHITAHGDGRLDINGRYDGVAGSSKYWSATPAFLALRGGSFADGSARLAVSDRSRFGNVIPTVYDRDSTVTFRLGHSVPEQEELKSVLLLENGESTEGGEASDLLDNSMRSYMIKGNKPEGIVGMYTYIWYMKEEGGAWKVLEGENNADFVLKGFAEDTRITQNYTLKRKVITGYADSETSSETMVLLSRKAIVFNGKYRSWADGTFARSAQEYRYPTAPYKYEGAIGSGVYRIDPDGPDGPIEPFDVYCDMETSGGGWMLAGKFSNNDEKSWITSKDKWTDTTTFGDATNIRNFADAKSRLWSTFPVDTLMFKTMRKDDKAFKTVGRKLNGTFASVPLSTFFMSALANFPNLRTTTAYQGFQIQFLNGATYEDFPWINGSAFKESIIYIGNSDADVSGPDSMGVISGCKPGRDSNNDIKADCGLGISGTPRFGQGPEESDIGYYGGEGASDVNNALLFVK